MKTLLEDYERRLKTVIKEISKGGNDLTINRLGTKASCYRTFISEMKKQLTLTDVVVPKGTLCGKSNCHMEKLESNVYCSYHYYINFG